MTKKRIKRSYTRLLWLLIPLAIFLFFARYLVQPVPAENIDMTSGLKNGAPQYPYFDEHKWDGGGVITFWFDDAWENQYTEGFKILDKYGYKAALAVPTGLVGYDAYMNWYQVRKLEYLGWEITAHSRIHDCDLSDKGNDFFVREIQGSKDDLKTYGILTDIYVAPCGNTTPESTEFVKNRFYSQRIVEPGLNDIPVQNRYGIKVIQAGRDTTVELIEQKIDEAVANDKWIIIMFHQVDYENEKYGITPEDLSELADYVHSIDVPVVIPSQVLEIK